jgi:hypothetical protein
VIEPFFDPIDPSIGSGNRKLDTGEPFFKSSHPNLGIVAATPSTFSSLGRG